jgi:hypothetical protein
MNRKYALVIGIENYPQTSGLSPVKYAVNDAQAMAGYAQQAGFYLINGNPLLDRKASYSEVIRHLKLLFHYARPGDCILLYFAGHGSVSEDGGYLIPFDYKKGKGIDESSCVSFDSINKRFKNNKTKRFLFFLDTCYSGFAGEQVDIRSAALEISPQVREKNEKQMKDMLEDNQSSRNVGRLIFTSSGPTEKSYHIKEFEHGLFTYFLLSALESKEDKQAINVEDLIRQVKDGVHDYCVSHGLDQTPHTYTNIQGTFLIPPYQLTQHDNTLKETVEIHEPGIDDRPKRYKFFDRFSMFIYIILNSFVSLLMIRDYLTEGGLINIMGGIFLGIVSFTWLFMIERWGLTKFTFSKKDKQANRIISRELVKIIIASLLSGMVYLNMRLNPDAFFNTNSFLLLLAVALNIRTFLELAQGFLFRK